MYIEIEINLHQIWRKKIYIGYLKTQMTTDNESISDYNFRILYEICVLGHRDFLRINCLRGLILVACRTKRWVGLKFIEGKSFRFWEQQYLGFWVYHREFWSFWGSSTIFRFLRIGVSLAVSIFWGIIDNI